MAASPPPKKGLFGKSAVSPVAAAPPMHNEYNKLNARLRISEERMNELRQKINLIESNLLNRHKKYMDEVRGLGGEILDVKHSIQDLKNKVLLVMKELQLTAQKEELDIVKKYLEMWQPVKFVTMATVERMIEDALAKHRKSNIAQSTEESS